MSKKKKEKITYYDDNSTIVDMSSVNREGKKRPPAPQKQNSTFKEKWKTYFAAVKMMLIPMCIVLLILCVMFLLPMLLVNC